jgi:hypothetical protein
MTILRTLLITAAGCFLLSLTAHADDRAQGAGIYLMGPGMPSVFTFDKESMSCSVSWGTMGAPGPFYTPETLCMTL